MIRVLIAKPGLDGHEAGAKLVATALRDAGMEVIYTGVRQTPASIARAALEEDMDVVGISLLSGSHLTLCREVVQNLREQGLSDVKVLVGGVIPPRDVPQLFADGVNAVFGPGSQLKDIVAWIRTHAPDR